MTTYTLKVEDPIRPNVIAVVVRPDHRALTFEVM